MTPADPSEDRYSRQIRFQPIGPAGQEKLLDARVTIVGCGALGSFQAGALARAGIGNLRIVDRDYVEWSNLQRQWLFDESDARDSLPKAVAAARKIAAINAQVRVEPVVSDLTSGNAEELLSAADLLLDGTDNFETRFLLNDWAVRESVPWIYGAAVGSYGLTMSVLPGITACLQCIYPEPPSGPQPTCETAGVLGPITSLIASLQVAEAIKILCGAAPSSAITTVDVWSGVIRQTARPQRDPQCPACARREFHYLDRHDRSPISLCGRNAVQINETSRPMNLDSLALRLAPLGKVRANEFALNFEDPPFQLMVFPDGRVIVKGTNDIGVARSVCARYLG
ncbi:MAG TPA: ThiF family adenylyltransferase [Bryobacteraceae bacterium]|nr:ThiF family adenylyltransferase [Bryobacteraceae bacterium]